MSSPAKSVRPMSSTIAGTGSSSSSTSRPTSAQLEQLSSRHSLAAAATQRPLSDIHGSSTYKSPEAQEIDRWFEDLNQYEKTLDEMGNQKLDDNFKEELTAIENWFRVLSDPERTATLYSLLKGTTPLQIRFFITVLQQMAAKDAHIMDPLNHSILRSPSGVRPTSTISNGGGDSSAQTFRATTSNEDLGRLFARPNSQRMSNEYSSSNIRAHSLLRSSSSQDDFSDESLSVSPRPIMIPTQQSQQRISPVKDDILGSADWQSKMTQRSSSLHMSVADLPKTVSKPPTISINTLVTKPITINNTLPPRSPSAKPNSPTSPTYPYSHIAANMSSSRPVQAANAAETPAIAPRQIGRSLPRPRQSQEDDEWDSHGVTLSRGKPMATASISYSSGNHATSSSNSSNNTNSPEAIDLNEIQDIPTWFRSLRLHKYSSIFENDDWRRLIRLSEEELIQRGVAALGARRKMLKVFEAVRNELDKQMNLNPEN